VRDKRNGAIARRHFWDSNTIHSFSGLALFKNEPLFFSFSIVSFHHISRSDIYRARSMMKSKILHVAHLIVLLSLLSAAAAEAQAEHQKEDVPPLAAQEKSASSVIALTEKDFDSSINDPKQPFWLLKFFAPW
jgi:hypothetical protein